MQFIQFSWQGDPQLLVEGQSFKPVFQLLERRTGGGGEQGGHTEGLGVKTRVWQGWEKTWKQYGSRGVQGEVASESSRLLLQILWDQVTLKVINSIIPLKFSHFCFAAVAYLLPSSGYLRGSTPSASNSAKHELFMINIVSTISTTLMAGAHRLSGARSQQATVSGKKAGGQSSGRNFSTNVPIFSPKLCVLGRHSGSA